MRGLALIIVHAAVAAAFVVPVAACDAQADSGRFQPVAPLELSGRVVDNAHILTSPQKSEIDAKLEAIEHDTRAQFVVVSTPSLEGLPIEEYGLRLGRGWGIGSKARNDGVLLIVAPNERKVRIEVGYGLEAAISDKDAYLIVQNIILPRYKAGDLPGGTMAGVDAIDQRLRAELRNHT